MSALHVSEDIQLASSLPSSFYTSQQIFNEAKEKIFARSWQLCLTLDDLRIPGQLYPFTLLPSLLDEPILFVRDGDDQFYCLSNVCTHRGNLLVESPCISQQIKCRYHGRRFKLSGEFVHMPEFQAAKNFPGPTDSLPKVACDFLGKFIFSSISPGLDFADLVDDIKHRLHWLRFQELRFDANRSRDYLVNAHWALYCENYLEGLHIPFVHPALRATIDFASYTTKIFKFSNLQIAHASPGEQAFLLPNDAIDYGQQIAAYYYWLFPNTMLNFYPWGCSVNIVKPISLTLTKVSFLTFIYDETKLDLGAGGDLDKVEREDEAIVEMVQKGIRSRLYKQGRYSPSYEQGVHHFHRLICDFLHK